MKLSIINKKYEQALIKLEQGGYGRKFPMPYQKTKGRFVASNLSLDLQAESGTSYDWWLLLKRIKGHLVLNTYPYSSTTRKHISKVSSVLDLLKVKYVEVAAPQGLQNFEAAKKEAANRVAKDFIRTKYQRGNKGKIPKLALEHLVPLKKIGIPVPKALIQESIKIAESDRQVRLESERLRRWFSPRSTL